MQWDYNVDTFPVYTSVYLHHIDRAYSTNGEKRNAYRIFLGKPEGKRPLGDEDVGGWIILKWILYRMGWYGLD
jgi:hypothetical protein